MFKKIQHIQKISYYIYALQKSTVIYALQIVMYALQKSVSLLCPKNVVKVLSASCYINNKTLSNYCAENKENNQYGGFLTLSIVGTTEACKICHQI